MRRGDVDAAVQLFHYNFSIAWEIDGKMQKGVCAAPARNKIRILTMECEYGETF